MDELDMKIAAALERDEAERFERLGADQPLHQIVFSTFRGRHRWVIWWLTLVGLVFFAFGIWCLVRFFQTENERLMLMWGFGALIGIFATLFIKVWFWIEIQKNSIVREIKRVELQLASLAAHLKK